MLIGDYASKLHESLKLAKAMHKHSGKTRCKKRTKGNYGKEGARLAVSSAINATPVGEPTIQRVQACEN